ncbi:hypothetical protein IMSHALPRED_002411 [Imshaugia aleurites]|uniref:Uncharacterized protein n=1 Tax=Imshaugia aleurites TaxID=172621 RepID=A0A8H3J5F3_9LECA|nr:hypothetical protein IMSHALPRED_002411 [Imshaugia aleurites]
MSPPLFAKYHKKIVKHSQKQSAWSSKARTLDARLGTRLGTLVYLPCEIRQQIFKHVFDNYYPGEDGRYARVPEIFEYLGRTKQDPYDQILEDHPTGGIFELDSYRIISGTGFVVNLRLASPTLKDEFEHFFLCSNVFKFLCPRRLGDFLRQLSSLHRAQLLRITIKVWSECRCCTRQESDYGWKLNCSLLPESLRLITIELELAQPRIRGGSRRGLAELEGLHHAAGLIKQLCIEVRRRSPGVVVAIHQDTEKELLQQGFDVLNSGLTGVQ